MAHFASIGPRRGLRPRLVAVAVVALGLSGPGCGLPPQGTARPPEYVPDQQTKSRAHANPLEPLVVEWPAAARAQLETQLRRGPVAVRHAGGTLEVVTGCHLPGEYTYSGTNVHHDRLVIADAEQLAAQLPLGAASLSGELEQSGRLEVQLTVVGGYALDRERVDLDGAEGCERATHYVAALSAGAFALSSGGSNGASAKAGVYGANVGAARQSRREILTRAGDVDACSTARPGDEAPPSGCGALVRVALAPFAVAPARLAHAVVRPPRAPAPLDPGAEPGSAPASEPGAADPPPPGGESEGPEAPLSSATEPAVPPLREPARRDTWPYRPEPRDRGPGPSEPTPAPPSTSGWLYAGLGLGAAVLVGLVVAAQVVKANAPDPPRGERPEGGLGSVTLSGAGLRF